MKPKNSYRYVFLLVLALAACSKQMEVATLEEQAIVGHNQSIESKPLVWDANGFLILSRKDSVPAIVQVTPNGGAYALADLSAYLPTGASLDSLNSFNVALLNQERIIFDCTIADTDSTTQLTAIELNMAGTKVGKMQTILLGSKDFRFEALSSAQSNQWFSISSKSEQQPTGSRSLLRASHYQPNANGTITTTSRIDTVADYSVGQVEVLSNGHLLVKLAQRGIGGIGPAQGLGVTAIMFRVYASASEWTDFVYDQSFELVYFVDIIDGQLVVVSQLAEVQANISYSISYFNLDGSLDKQTFFELSKHMVIASVCFAADGSIYLGGYNNGQMLFDWNALYSLNESTPAMAKLNTDGSVAWQQVHNTSYSGLMVGIHERSDGKLNWLMAKLGFGLFKNILILTSDPNGNM